MAPAFCRMAAHLQAHGEQCVHAKDVGSMQPHPLPFAQFAPEACHPRGRLRRMGVRSGIVACTGRLTQLGEDSCTTGLEAYK